MFFSEEIILPRWGELAFPLYQPSYTATVLFHLKCWFLADWRVWVLCLWQWWWWWWLSTRWLDDMLYVCSCDFSWQERPNSRESIWTKIWFWALEFWCGFLLTLGPWETAGLDPQVLCTAADVGYHSMVVCPQQHIASLLQQSVPSQHIHMQN